MVTVGCVIVKKKKDFTLCICYCVCLLKIQQILKGTIHVSWIKKAIKFLNEKNKKYGLNLESIKKLRKEIYESVFTYNVL